jgi:hypothetical protein
MQIEENKHQNRDDPIVSPSDSPSQKSKKRRAAYLIVLGLCIIALLVLTEWLVNGTIMLSKMH